MKQLSSVLMPSEPSGFFRFNFQTALVVSAKSASDEAIHYFFAL
jgi:hypothetical protein